MAIPYGRCACARKKELPMSKKLLIDARQSEETRIVVLNNNKVEDFDHETSHRKQLKGNIYLARVTRVEPSLQAAFVEYGGNRQGFLAFSEIHPDYYRIPVEDREKLLAEELGDEENASLTADIIDETDPVALSDDNTAEVDLPDAPVRAEEGEAKETSAEIPGEDDAGDDNGDDDRRENRRRFARFSRHYKIQEVISRRQIMLIQVVKEERGNKGAALTTYLSLAGRYCVLMPNTYHGGGVSRKISNPADRKKLKTIVNSLDVPQGMAVIVRTAGSKRTKAEITRDYNYLSRQWDEIRSMTMESNAPSLIYEEGNLIKRAIRDYYGTDIDEILVEGAEAYKAARMHMKSLMPSHVRKVKAYEDTATPLFQRHQVEHMLSSMHDPQVTLRSGGYIVINQTEALVAIDVNSGRATKERNIEETALKTNIEAADEIAQQLRQRDLSGLIVIDFIDMENNRNQHTVERRLKEAMKNDRARIQIGGISQFGLLEMSRQRLRPSLSETVTDLCPHCQGTGRIRSVESAALEVLRAIEIEAGKKNGEDLNVYMASAVAIYILNNKRDQIAEIENRFGIRIFLEEDNSLIAPDLRFGDNKPLSEMREANRESNGRRRGRGGKNVSDIPETAETSPAAENENDIPAAEEDDDDKPRRRRRRGKRGGRRRRRDEISGTDTLPREAGAEDAPLSSDEADATGQSIDETEREAGEAGPKPGNDDADGKSKPKRRRRRKNQSKGQNAETANALEISADQPQDQSDQGSGKAIQDNDTDDVVTSKGSSKASEDKAENTPPKAKKAKKAWAKKSSAKNAKAKVDADANEDNAESEAKPKAKKAKATKKSRATKKAAKTDSGAASRDHAPSDAPSVKPKAERQPLSSAEVAVVNVDAAKPEAKKKGWWSL